MGRTLSLPLGVVVAREKIDHPWQEYAWRPVEVFLNAPEVGDWKVLRETSDFTHYHAATVPLELHRKETAGYLENLEFGTPSLYVVLREADIEEDSAWPVTVHLVTASPFESAAYGEDGSEIVGVVAMPGPLIELLRAFIGEHHVDEPFIKRKRKNFVREVAHSFGQEPIVELRARKKLAGKGKTCDGTK